VAALAPAATESQEDEWPEVKEKVELKVAAAEVLLVLLEVDEAREPAEVADVVVEGLPDKFVDMLIELLEAEMELEEVVIEAML
jgi:hypothetical protein